MSIVLLGYELFRIKHSSFINNLNGIDEDINDKI